MNSLLSSSVSLALLLLSLVLLSGLLLALAQRLSTHWPALRAWRGFWIGAWLIPWTPCLLYALPSPVVQLTDLNLPPLVDSVSDLLIPKVPAVASASEGVSWTLLLTFLVLGVLLVNVLLLAKLGFRYWQLQCQLQRDAESQPELSPVIARYCRRLQRLGGFQLTLSSAVGSPFLFGCFKPRLVLTNAAIAGLDWRSLQLVVRHELVHLRQGDHLLVLLAHVSNALAWFNPWHRRLVAHMMAAVELRCDEGVLRKKPNAAPHYARTLLRMLAITQDQQPALVSTFTQANYKEFKMRLNRVVNQPMALSWLQQGTCATVLGLVLIAAWALQPLQALAAELEAVEFQHPLPAARISSSFGQKTTRFHNGIDLAIAKGTPIVATARGVVLVSTDVYGDRVNYGKLIIIAHPNGLKSLYSHLDSRTVSVGDAVAAGQLIGTVGETGKVTGPHLHFEILDGDQRLNPADFIQFNKQSAARAALAHERMRRVY